MYRKLALVTYFTFVFIAIAKDDTIFRDYMGSYYTKLAYCGNKKGRCYWRRILSAAS